MRMKGKTEENIWRTALFPVGPLSAQVWTCPGGKERHQGALGILQAYGRANSNTTNLSWNNNNQKNDTLQEAPAQLKLKYILLWLRIKMLKGLKQVCKCSPATGHKSIDRPSSDVMPMDCVVHPLPFAFLAL